MIRELEKLVAIALAESNEREAQDIRESLADVLPEMNLPAVEDPLCVSRAIQVLESETARRFASS